MTDQPAEAQPGYMLLGGIAEGPDAPWFFKFTGPEATIRDTARRVRRHDGVDPSGGLICAGRRSCAALVVAAVTLVFLGCLLAILITGPVMVRVQRDGAGRGSIARTAARGREPALRGVHAARLPADAATWTGRPSGSQDEFRARRPAGGDPGVRLPEGRYRNVIGRAPGPGRRPDSVHGHRRALRRLRRLAGSRRQRQRRRRAARTGPHAAAMPPRAGPSTSSRSAPRSRRSSAPKTMGSYRFARRLREKGLRVELMVALDLVGCYSDEPGSQRFPLPGLGLLYPDRGNFIAVVGDLRLRLGDQARTLGDAGDAGAMPGSLLPRARGAGGRALVGPRFLPPAGHARRAGHRHGLHAQPGLPHR